MASTLRSPRVMSVQALVWDITRRTTTATPSRRFLSASTAHTWRRVAGRVSVPAAGARVQGAGSARHLRTLQCDGHARPHLHRPFVPHVVGAVACDGRRFSWSEATRPEDVRMGAVRSASPDEAVRLQEDDGGDEILGDESDMTQQESDDGIMDPHPCDERGDVAAGEPWPPLAGSGFTQADLEDLPVLPADSARKIFVNNEFNMADVDVIGFDYDYTLANYTKRLPRLVYEMALEYLVKKLRYPSILMNKYALEYDDTFACRGISFDRRTGLLLKLDSFSSIMPTSVHRGRTRLTAEEVAEVYGRTRHINVRYRDLFIRPLVDLFAVAEANVLAVIIQYLNDKGINYSPSAVSDDILEAIEWVHMSGKMHNIVSNNLERFLSKDPNLRVLLPRFRAEGKELFLLTNSSFDYVNAGLTYLLGDQWRDLFDYVMVRAEKPKFYSRSRPFRELETQTERVRWTKVKSLEKNRVYVQGSVQQLLKLTGWGDKTVLYVGDSMYSDWKEPNVSHGWIIGGIIHELEAHINRYQNPDTLALVEQMELHELLFRRVQLLDASTSDGQAKLLELYHAATDDPVPEGGVTRSLVLDKIEQRRNILRLQRQAAHNAHFGSIFVSTTSPTLFAFSLMRYVDFYTSHLTNFLAYPADYRFSPPRRLMPHQNPEET